MPKKICLSQRIADQLAGLRLDQAAAELFPDYSRGRLQLWIKHGELMVDGKRAKPSARVVGGETLNIEAELKAEGEVEPQNIPLDIIFEDEHLLVLNKPAGLVVHPAVGNWDGTLQNALLHYDADLGSLPRSGIVHRLDKDTSGVMVVARSLKAHASLVEQLQTRSMSRVYEAVVIGEIPSTGTIDAPIGRHPKIRKKMAVVASGKLAVSHYALIQRLPGTSHVQVSLESGRTHQIRVHMAHIGYPIVGDPVYRKRTKKHKVLAEETQKLIDEFPRQALHARTLRLTHPVMHKTCEFNTPLARDIDKCICYLKQHRLT